MLLLFSNSESKLLDLNKNSYSDLQNQILNLSHDKPMINKYKHFALKISSDLIEIIDNLNQGVNIDKSIEIEEMKIFLRVICNDIEILTNL